MGRSQDDLPSKESAGSQLEKKDVQGGVIQRRFFDDKGRAKLNNDYDQYHEKVGIPHAHDWDWAKKPYRQRARALRPGES